MRGNHIVQKLEISLKAARVNAGLSAEEVASKMNVRTDEVEAWEKDSADVTVMQARRLSELYRIPLDNIFFG